MSPLVRVHIAEPLCCIVADDGRRVWWRYLREPRFPARFTLLAEILAERGKPR